MKGRLEYDFEYFLQNFVDELSGEGEDFNNTVYRKCFFKPFQDAKRDFESVMDGIRNDIETNLNHYKDEIVEKMISEFSEFYWEKFQDGHDWYDGMKAICYFKDSDKYFIGTAKHHSEGTNFILENGSCEDPDYVAPLYLFKEKK